MEFEHVAIFVGLCLPILCDEIGPYDRYFFESRSQRANHDGYLFCFVLFFAAVSLQVFPDLSHYPASQRI